MKRLLILFLSFFIFPAYAVTSESYVDSAVNTLQNEIPAENANTVLTNTGTAGEIGTKKIYDSTQDFSTQTDALVTAATFNAAVQNAIDNEFVCVESIPEGCLLYKIMVKQTPPSTYTQLEYLEATGTQYIDTNTYLNGASKVEFQFSCDTVGNYALFGASNGNAYNKGEIAVFWYNKGVDVVIPTSNFSGTAIYCGSTLLTPDQTYTISYDKDFFTLDERSWPSGWYTNYVGQRSVFLFASNRGSDSWIGGHSKLYWFKIYNSNTLVRNFIPARRNSDGELGMYDTVSGAFFTNAGTGSFIAGPDVVSNLYLPNGN